MRKLLVFVVLVQCLFSYSVYSKDITDLWNDYLIKSRVERSLYQTKQINSRDIVVSVEKQVVTLEGEVDSQIQKDIAFRTAKARRGVTQVVNFLEIRNQDMSLRLKARRNPAVIKSDRAIIDRCQRVLSSNREVYKSGIEVNCYNHVVTLKGSVGSRLEKSIAEKLVSKIQGVQHVRNKLNVN